MVNQVALDSALHQRMRVITTPSARYGDNVNFFGVVPREYGRLVAHYPIFFHKNSETGQFEPGVLLGFNPNENLFLAGERWDAPYMPLNMQRRPFTVVAAGTNAEGNPNLIVSIDADNPRVQEEAGELLFLDGGKTSDYLQRMTAVLSELVDGSRAAYAYTAKLSDLNLIESVRLDVEFIDQSKIQVQGLYSIQAEVLRKLPAKKLAELRDAGYLELIYFQMASMAHIAGLVTRKNRLLGAA